MSSNTVAVSCFLSMALRIASVVCKIDVSVEFHFLLRHCLGDKHWFAIEGHGRHLVGRAKNSDGLGESLFRSKMAAASRFMVSEFGIS